MVSNLARTGLDKDTTATGGFWMNAQGGTSTYDATNSTFDYTNNLYGIALGYNQTVLNDLRVGVMVGYDNQKMRTGTSYSDLYRNSYDNKADGAYLSAHATKDFDNVMFKKVVVDLGLSLGYQSHDDKRFVNDNLAWWGQSYAKSSYNSVWYNPELGVSIPFSVIDESITLSPNARLSWAGQHIDSYTENGSNSNASVDSRNLGVLESRIGLDLTKQYNGGSVTISAGYLNRTLTSSNSVKVSMIGDTQNVDYHYQNIDAGYLRGALSANVMENIELGVNGTYINGSGMDGGSASATIKVKF
jgi:outer membrane autotransporter protein